MKRRSFLGFLASITFVPRVVGIASASVEDVLLVVTVKDRRNPDPNLAPGGYDRGDVVEVLPMRDYHGAVNTHDFWRILPVSGMGVERARKLLQPGTISSPHQFERRVRGRRALTLNLDALTGSVAEYLADDERRVPVCPVVLSVSEIDRITRFRPEVPDALVLGSHSSVVG